MLELRQPLNPQQIEVLRWIADDCPDGIMDSHAYQHSVGALRDRRLVTISKKGRYLAS